MKKMLLAAALGLFSLSVTAQFAMESKDTSWKSIFRASETRFHDVVHTKLDVSFDFSKAQINGKEWLTLKPTCYATDTVSLDAKGMDIREVSIVNGTVRTPLKYRYDSARLYITLDRTYTNLEKYTLYFDYTGKPNDLKSAGSAAITDAKGLYFINPQGSDKNKPTQIWTQGETESNSAWMITIDKPNQKSTQEISMTVPEKYVTLSNGILAGQKKNLNGTRTDTWKMDLPHAPYLFFMGVGEYAILKDQYKGKEVSYYVEKDYQPYARLIFGNTPEMMGFFSKKLGVEFPWPKYAQIVGRDFVSGAMENTTATLHQEGAYQNARQLKDGNVWEETIAHELFHQWFGDLVTCESWSQITVNESFANYSEYLWDEYKYGKDHADAHGFEDMQGYLMSGSEKKDLVRYHYASREDVFDAVSYNKGGRILHMLRNQVGDEAFFKALQLYLTQNKFKTGEADQLRLAFEEVTGRDLNGFWNQWYYGSGHPKLKINYAYDSTTRISTVIVEQTQKTGKMFQLPLPIDVYDQGKKTRYAVTLKGSADTFHFVTTQKPEWISVDADRTLLCERTDNKSEYQYVNQWKYAKHYLDRKEAIDYYAKNNLPQLAKGLDDSYYKIRIQTLQKLSTSAYRNDPVVLEDVVELARKDPNNRVKAAALQYLDKLANEKYLPLFEKSISDSSYSVAGAAMKGYLTLRPDSGLALARRYSGDAKGMLGEIVRKELMEKGSEDDFAVISKGYRDEPLSQEKFDLTEAYAKYLIKVKDLDKVKTGIDDMMIFRNAIPGQFRSFVDPEFKRQLDAIAKEKGSEIEKYVEKVFQ